MKALKAFLAALIPIGLLCFPIVASSEGDHTSFAEADSAFQTRMQSQHGPFWDSEAIQNIPWNADGGPGPAPMRGVLGGIASPFYSTRHCELDWIVAASTTLEGVESPNNIEVLMSEWGFTQAQAESWLHTHAEFSEFLATLEIEYFLNGEAHEHVSTAVKYHKWEMAVTGSSFGIWYSSTGFFIEPGQLDIGFHILGIKFKTNDVVNETAHAMEIVSHEDHLLYESLGTWRIWNEWKPE